MFRLSGWVTVEQPASDKTTALLHHVGEYNFKDGYFINNVIKVFNRENRYEIYKTEFLKNDLTSSV